jgi:hypothetical protein
MVRGLVVGLIGLIGCVEPASQTCVDGRVCASNTHCDDANHRCITDEQTAACAVLPDGEMCTVNGVVGACVVGACILPACGDGLRTGVEICEGDDLAGETCASLGYYQATSGLACNSDCTFNTDGCTEICGDGIINGSEDCDGDALGGDCTTAGFYDAPGLACTKFCTWNVASCVGKCGDGMIQGGEVCDGAPPQNGCLSYAFDYGAIGCALCGPEFTHCGNIGWRNDTFQPPQVVQAFAGNSLDDVWASGAGYVAHRVNDTWTVDSLSLDYGGSLALRGTNEVFVRGSSKVANVTQPFVQHFNGSVWAPIALPSVNVATNEFVQALAAASNGDVYAGTNLALYRYDGAAWTRLTAAVQLADVSPVSPTDVWVVGLGQVRHWNGSTLSINSPAACASSVNEVYAADATHVFATCDNGIGQWNGASWSFYAVPGISLYGLSGQSATEVVATGSLGTVLVFDGTTWHDVSTGATTTLGSGLEIDGTVFASSGTRIAVLNGSTWQPSPTTSQGTETYGLWATSDTAFVATNDGAYQRQLDGTWKLTSSAYVGEALWGFSRNDVFASGQGNQIWHWNGVDWQSSATPTYASKAPFGIWGTSASDLYLASMVGTPSSNPTIEHWNGTAWSLVYTATTIVDTVQQIRGSSTNDVWVTLGTAVLLHWNGIAWTEITVPGTAYINAVWPFSSTNVIAVGDGIHVWNGATWTKQTVDVFRPFTDVWARSTSDVFAAGQAGVTVHYNGAAWTPVRDGRDDGSTISSIYGSSDHVFFAREDTGNADVLLQLAPWQ